jgi:hypothetical protein
LSTRKYRVSFNTSQTEGETEFKAVTDDSNRSDLPVITLVSRSGDFNHKISDLRLNKKHHHLQPSAKSAKINQQSTSQSASKEEKSYIFLKNIKIESVKISQKKKYIFSKCKQIRKKLYFFEKYQNRISENITKEKINIFKVQAKKKKVLFF